VWGRHGQALERGAEQFERVVSNHAVPESIERLFLKRHEQARKAKRSIRGVVQARRERVGDRAPDNAIEVAERRQLRQAVVFRELADPGLAQRRLIGETPEDKRCAVVRRQQPSPESRLSGGERDDVVSMERAQRVKRSEAIGRLRRNRGQLVQSSFDFDDALNATAQP
jgi:hypothetical protein